MMGVKIVDNPLPWILSLLVIGIIAGALIMVASLLVLPTPTPLTQQSQFLCTHTTNSTTPIQLDAILHYATSTVVPQQSHDEISISFHLLKTLSPCNFLVFGLGHDSLMWASFNSGGTTLFLEEDPNWVNIVLKDAPILHAVTFPYRTQLSQADQLLVQYRTLCTSPHVLRNNTKCPLALHNLPDEVYSTEWDVIMIDAPRGYFAEAPGRMGAIYSAAVMARKRRKAGVTHVMLHDVDRRVEKLYAETFLCRKNLVGASGRLWHFQIAPDADILATDNVTNNATSVGFC